MRIPARSLREINDDMEALFQRGLTLTGKPEAQHLVRVEYAALAREWRNKWRGSWRERQVKA